MKLAALGRVCALTVAAAMASAWPADSEATSRPRTRLDNAGITESGSYEHSGIFGASFGQNVITPRYVAGGRVAHQYLPVGPSAGPPGRVVGTVWSEFQAAYGPAGRQVECFNGKIHVVWTDLATPSWDPLQVYSRWNRVVVTGSPTTVTLDDGKSLGILPTGAPLTVDGTRLPGRELGAYPTVHVLPNGRAAVVHQTWDTDDLVFSAGAFEFVSGAGVFSSSELPGSNFNDDQQPRSVSGYACGDTVIHVVTHRWIPSSDFAYELWYKRGTIAGASVSWDPPVLLDTLFERSAVVEVHGDSVAAVYIRKMASGANDWDRHVCYRLSSDCGSSWGSVTNISDYGADDHERAYRHLGAVFDEDGVLHVAWNTVWYDASSNEVSTIPCILNHWNSQRNTVRQIAVSNWNNNPPSGCNVNSTFNNGTGSAFTTITMMNLSVKPAGAGAGAGIADELLYASWVQAGPTQDDCATQDSAGTPGGIVNSEIYMSVSSDDGFTWDRPQNLTGTRTPNCLPGNCHSEHFLSAASQADSGLYLSFVDDSHAGMTPGFYGPNSEWSESPYMVLAVATRAPIPSPVIGIASARDFLELNVGTTGSKTVDIVVASLGNTALNFDIRVMGDDGGSSHVLVNGSGVYSGSIPAGGAQEVVTVEFDGIGLPAPSEWNWRLEVTSNDSTNNPAQGGQPIDINLNVFVSDAWFTCTRDTISTGQHRLAVSSCLELGNQGSDGGLYRYSNTAGWIFDASPVIALLDGPTKRAYRDFLWTGPADRSRDSNQAFRAQSVITVNRNTTVNGKAADRAFGVATTTDSLIQIDWEVTAFREPDLTKGAVARYVLTNLTGTTFTNLALGAVADLDVDSLSGDNDGIADATAQYIGAQGGYRDGAGVFTPQNNYAALFNIPLDAGCADAAVGGVVLDNVDYVYPENAYNTDSLYNVMNRIAGWDASTLQADTITDVNVVLTVSKGNTLTPAGSLEFAIGLAVSDVSVSNLDSTVELLKNAVNDACIVGCPITLTGDVNLSGTVTSADIIALVNFVFKGGMAPAPCPAAGDVNCNGTVTSADIVHLVNFVFKGGAAPCDGCTSPLAAGC